MSTLTTIPIWVAFDNAKEYAISSGSHNKILLEYVVNPEHRVTCKDWVGIFPNDCSFQNSFDFDRMVSYEFVLHRPISTKELRYKMKISLEGAQNLNFDEEYVFVYFNSNSELLGVSDSFRFIDPAVGSDLSRAQQDHNMPNFHSKHTENKEEMQNEYDRNNKLAKFNKQKNYRSKQRFFPIPEEIPVKKSTLGAEEENFVDYQQGQVMKVKDKKFYQGHLNKVHREFVQCSVSNAQFFSNCKPNSNCSNCQRVGALLGTQSELYVQVKNLAEINSELIEKISYLEKQIELGQAAYQKQSVLLMRERESRLFYQNCVKESGQNYQKYLNVYQPVLVGFDYYHSPIIAYQNMQFASRSLPQMGSDSQMLLTPIGRAPCDRTRPEERTRVNQLLKLKAIIGNQEEKLRALSVKLALEENNVRSLTQRLAEVQCSNVQKVKAVVKDFKDLSCGDNSFNNNVGEEVEHNS